MMTLFRPVGIRLLAALAAAALTACGGALHSAVDGDDGGFELLLDPDYGRQGTTFAVLVSFPEEAVERFGGPGALVQIRRVDFGRNMYWNTFDMNAETLKITFPALTISGAAVVGEREVRVELDADGERVEGRASLFVLKAVR